MRVGRRSQQAAVRRERQSAHATGRAVASLERTGSRKVCVSRSLTSSPTAQHTHTDTCILRCLYTGGVGKRTRKRRREQAPAAVSGGGDAAAAPPSPRWGARLTRVRLDDAEWEALRALADDQGIPVSEFLGRLVRRSLASRGPRRTPATQGLDG